MDDSNKHPAEEKKVKFRVHLLDSKNSNKAWVIIITILSFLLSAVLSLASTGIIELAGNIVVSSIVLIIIVVVNIVFDIVGTAVTAADEAPFHAMASRKLYGAKQTIRLIRNADKVSNFCNDVVGDICGVISGAASTYIIASFVLTATDSETTLASLIVTGFVAAMTVGGKALGKSIAIQNSNYIVYKAGVILKFFVGRIDYANVKKKRKKELKES